MAYISLYRKYRPAKFSDVVGQEVIVKILKNSIINNKISHAYIFSGPRGTGKTSIAKIFAKAVNCSHNLGDVCDECDNCKKNIDEEIDIIEIDAASNNGVDEIREIRNSVKLMPSNLKYKVYIIDEVHMLSTSAFNALLKTLEEPPSHVIFILATTEFNKIPATVISRCQKFDFKRINNQDIVNRLKYILECENKALNDDVLNLIAKLSDGGLRDSINLLDQVLTINDKDVTVDAVYNLIGQLNDNEIKELLLLITTGDIKGLLAKINSYAEKGKNFVSIINRLELLLRNILIFNSTNNYFDKEYEKILSEFTRVDIDKLLELSNILFNLTNELKKSNNQQTLIEIYFLKMAILFTKNAKNNKIDTNIENRVFKNEINNEIDTNLNNDNDTEIKKININNAFYGADKELKKEFLSKYSKIKEYVANKEYNSISNLLLKATAEVVSNKNIIFTFKNNFEVVLFDKNIDDIQKFLKMLYNTMYTVVAISEEEWLEVKKEYINNIKSGYKYEYIDAKPKIKKSNKNTVLQDSVESIFGNKYTTM